MDANVFRSTRARYGAALVVMGFLALEAALGGHALNLLVEQAVQVQASASVGHLAFR